MDGVPQACSAQLLISMPQTAADRLPHDRRESWQAELQEVRTRCKRALAQRQVCGGGSLVELHLTHVEVTLPHLVELTTGRRAAAALAVTAAGAGIAVLFGNYWVLASGVWSASRVGLDVARRSYARECFQQLSQLSQLAASPSDDPQALDALHDAHFRLTESGKWQPTRGRWEPKARFAVLLAEMVMSSGGDGPLEPKLLRRLCMGDKQFIGLSGLVTLGVNVDAEHQHQSRFEPMARLASWVQEALLPRLTRGDASGRAANEGFVLLSELLESLVYTALGELAQCTAQVAASAAAVEREGLENARGATHTVSEAVVVLKSVLQRFHAAAEAVLPPLQQTSKLLRVDTVAGAGVEHAFKRIAAWRLCKYLNTLADASVPVPAATLVEELTRESACGCEELEGEPCAASPCVRMMARVPHRSSLVVLGELMEAADTLQVRQK